MSSSRITIRPARPEDKHAIAHICLMTAHQGKSAEAFLTLPELPALVWALPYVTLPTGFGFVMVEESSDGNITPTFDDAEQGGNIVGYIVGTSDTASYELAAEEQWWPALRALYPCLTDRTLDPTLTPLDRHYLGSIHAGTHAPRDVLAFSGATVHIDILPEYQGHGWGRRLMQFAATHLERSGTNGLWVGSNGEEGRKFYRKVGFRPLRDKYMGLRFEEFVAPRASPGANAQ